MTDLLSGRNGPQCKTTHPRNGTVPRANQPQGRTNVARAALLVMVLLIVHRMRKTQILQWLSTIKFEVLISILVQVMLELLLLILELLKVHHSKTLQ